VKHGVELAKPTHHIARIRHKVRRTKQKQVVELAKPSHHIIRHHARKKVVLPGVVIRCSVWLRPRGVERGEEFSDEAAEAYGLLCPTVLTLLLSLLALLVQKYKSTSASNSAARRAGSCVPHSVHCSVYLLY
jgi:hypothetical protein